MLIVTPQKCHAHMQKVINTFERNPVGNCFAKIDMQQILSVLQDLEETMFCYQKDQCAPLQERVEIFEEYLGVIKKIDFSIQKSKSIFEKIKSLFFYLSKKEEKFCQIKKRAKKSYQSYCLEYKKLWDVFDFYATIFNKHCVDTENSVKEQLKEQAFRLVGKKRTNSWIVNGWDPILAIRSMIKDLSAFLGEFSQNLQDEDHIALQEVIQDFKKMELIELKSRYSRMKFFGDKPFSKDLRIRDLAKQIVREIQSLQIGEAVSFSGGYITTKTGHAVVYEIKKREKKSYTFSLYNTGGGVANTNNFILDIYGVLTESQQLLQYEKISSENIFNIELFSKLLDYSNNKNTVERSMRDVYQTLDQCLSTKPVFGSAHHLQTNGTCAWDSLVCWISGRLSPGLFHAFMAYSTKNALEQFHKNQKKYHNFLDKESIDTLRSWGVLSLREKMSVFTNPVEKNHWIKGLAKSFFGLPTHLATITEKERLRYGKIAAKIGINTNFGMKD